MRDAALWLVLFVAILAVRMTHRDILWVEEAYPSAAAIQMSDHGKSLYRDFVFDKPPLSAMVYRLWGGRAGVPLRVAGSVYVLACCALAFLIARRWWGRAEAWLAALLLAFYLHFGIPAAVMALAPDLLTLLPMLAAVWASEWSAALPFLWLAARINGKALLFAPVCGLPTAAAVALLVAADLAWLADRAMWEQVWQWGAAYSRDTPVAAPLAEGAVRTLAWCGFQATAVLGAIWMFRRERHSLLLRWTLASFVMVCLGLRFSPRYYLVLLPPLALAGARGLMLMSPRLRAAALALLLIPAARFGPRFLNLDNWADTAMNRDSAEAARIINAQSKPGDTILVWGYRPDILVYTRLPLGAPFLDSQPLTGVIADRHLTRSDATFPELAARNRARLAALSPTWVVDGLGPYNPTLAIAHYPDLGPWLARYVLAGETKGTRIYRLRP